MKIHNTIKLFLAVTTTLLLAACGGDDATPKGAAAALPVDKSIARRVDSLLAQTPPPGTLGVALYDITAGQPLYGHHADSLYRPASCMKLLTAIATLRYTGTRYAYRTRLYTTGTMLADTLRGDVILKAQLDPAFNRDSLQALVGILKEKGIRHIEGRVILDMTILSPMNHEAHWTPGDLRTRRMGLLYQGFRRMQRELAEALSASGIPTTARDVTFGRLNPHTATLQATITTPISSVVFNALRYSSNINAESLLYVLGYIHNHRGNLRSEGIHMLRHFIRHELHLAPDSVAVIHDGCGLCPDDRMSPQLLIALLRYAAQRPWMYHEISAAMPLLGIDGTLSKRLRDKPEAGKLVGKTGTLTREGGISTLAGYFLTPVRGQNHIIAYAIMNNLCPVDDGRWWQDKAIKALHLATPFGDAEKRKTKDERRRSIVNNE